MASSQEISTISYAEIIPMHPITFFVFRCINRVLDITHGKYRPRTKIVG